jgi:hypothetical protein
MVTWGATSNRRASTVSTTTATPPAGWALVSGGRVISVLFVAQAESSAIATIAQIVRIKVIVLPPFSSPSNTLRGEQYIDTV